MANETKDREPLTFKKATISLILVLLVVLGVTVGKKAFPSAGETAVAKDPSVELASCRLVLAPLAGDKPIDREIAQQQTLILKGTSGDTAFERLGWMFVKKARLSFDDGFYKLAEQCAACLEARGSTGPDVLLLRAHALHSVHRFDEAERAARELINLRQRPFDYGVVGDILIDQGKIHEGAAAYQKMVDLRPDLQSYSRAAHVRWLTGDRAGAIELMRLATSAASPNDPEAAAWAFTRLAGYLLQHSGAKHAGTKQALAACDAALSLQTDYAPAMLARGRTLLALNRPADAVVELERAAKLNPLPEYKSALNDALAFKRQRDQKESGNRTQLTKE